jgi:hypothetical protein
MERRATRMGYPRTVGWRLVPLLLAGAALAAAPPAAAGRSGADVAATQALARATDALVRASTPDVPRGVAAVKSYANRVAGECPAVAAGSPQNHDSEQLANELVGALTATGYHVAAAPIATFARAVRGLHWSNPRLTRAVRTFATKLRGLSTLAVPALCTDIKAWVTSGYATLPASTVQFDRRYAEVDVEAEESPEIIRLATPYAIPADFAVLRRVERLEAKLAEAEAHAVSDYTHLMNTLELQQ